MQHSIWCCRDSFLTPGALSLTPKAGDLMALLSGNFIHSVVLENCKKNDEEHGFNEDKKSEPSFSDFLDPFCPNDSPIHLWW